MRSLPRLLAPLSVAAAFAVAAPAAQAVPPVATFPGAGVTVEIADPGASSDTVNLTITADTADDLVTAKVFLGDSSRAHYSIDAGGVRDARDDADFEELSTQSCSVYDGEVRYPVVADDTTITAVLPKGEVIWTSSIGVAVGDLDTHSPCDVRGHDGLAFDFTDDQQSIEGFTWDAPAKPAVTATGGYGQVALSFDTERGTSYNVYRVIGGVREDESFRWVDGSDADVPVSIYTGADDGPLAAGTAYAFQVQAVRNSQLLRRRGRRRADQPVQRRRHRHDRRPPDAPVPHHAAGDHDRAERAVHLVDHRQRRGRRAVLHPGHGPRRAELGG